MRACLCACALLVGCAGAGPSDAGLDAGADAGEQGGMDAGVDAGTDGGALAVGSPGFCRSQWAGKTGILVLAASTAGGSSLYRVYPDADWDEHVADLVYNGNSLSIADFTIAGTNHYATNGVAWWLVPGPSLPTGTYELGAAIPFGPNGTPPSVSYVTGNPWIGRSGTSLIRISPGAMVDWTPNGSVLGPGASCTAARDFSSGSAGGSTFTYLATCNNDPNAVVTVNVSQDTNGTWVGSSTIGTLPYQIAQPVIAISDGTQLTATKIYSAGVFRRDIKVCLNEGTLAAPISGLRAVVK